MITISECDNLHIHFPYHKYLDICDSKNCSLMFTKMYISCCYSKKVNQCLLKNCVTHFSHYIFPFPDFLVLQGDPLKSSSRLSYLHASFYTIECPMYKLFHLFAKYLGVRYKYIKYIFSK